MSVKIKPLTSSQKKRILPISLETALIDCPTSRVSEDHASEYIAAHIQDEFPTLDILVSCDRKLKVSSVAIKAKGDNVSIQISGIQVSYKTLPEVLVLTRKLLKVYDDRNIVIKFPSGSRSKGMSAKQAKACLDYGIGRFDGFDTAIAAGATHVCTSCSYTFTAVNCPDPCSPYTCPECHSKMASSRLNYNYRIDNSGKHWGTLLPKEFKSSISIHSLAFRTFSLKDQKAILELQGLTIEDLPSGYLNTNDRLNLKVEQKADAFTEIKYGDLKKLVFKWCKEKNHDKPKLLKRDALLEFCAKHGIKP